MRPLLPQQGDIEEDRWLRLTPILLTNPRIPVSPPPPSSRRHPKEDELGC